MQEGIIFVLAPSYPQPPRCHSAIMEGANPPQTASVQNRTGTRTPSPSRARSRWAATLVLQCAAIHLALTEPSGTHKAWKKVWWKGKSFLSPFTSPQHVPASSSLPPASRGCPAGRKHPFHQPLLLAVTQQQQPKLNLILSKKN